MPKNKTLVLIINRFATAFSLFFFSKKRPVPKISKSMRMTETVRTPFPRFSVVCFSRPSSLFRRLKSLINISTILSIKRQKTHNIKTQKPNIKKKNNLRKMKSTVKSYYVVELRAFPRGPVYQRKDESEYMSETTEIRNAS